MTMRFRALDLCAGVGGLSIGLQRAGFDVHGVELNACAAGVHRLNVGPCDCADLWEYAPRERYDLVAGGIPCQSHSIAGKRKGTIDPRGQLYVPFLRIAQEAGARAILIENVRGILSSPSATHGTSIRELCAAVCVAGLEHLAYRVLNAADYGVPQTRHRLFLVAFASAADLARFRWPEPTHSQREDFRGLPRWVSLREALGLPAGEYQVGRIDGATGWQGQRLLDPDAPSPTVGGTVADLLDQQAPAVKANAAREGFDPAVPNRRKWGQLQRELSALDRPAPCVTATEHKSALAFGSEGATTNPRRCGDVINPLLTALARAGFDDRPATTIDTSGALSAAGYHKSNKDGAVRLTIEQLAALQSFPPGFVFSGGKTEQHKQIGNAVPPPLAAAVGGAVLAALA
jgi:DNA (cytosine-5)-methyltransferase 1